MKRSSPRDYHSIQIEHDGITYSGRYHVEKGWIEVSDATGSKGTNLHQSTAETLASIMLGELVREELQRQARR
jgi:hypothetical protein